MNKDDIDESIIRLLKQNGRISTAAMSRLMAVPEPTVRRRLNRLLESGAVRIAAITNPREMGLKVSAFIGFEVEREQMEELAQYLSSFENIETVSVVTGPSHIMVRGYFRTTEDLYDFVLKKISAVSGVRTTRSLIVMRDYKTIMGYIEGQPATDFGTRAEMVIQPP